MTPLAFGFCFLLPNYGVTRELLHVYQPCSLYELSLSLNCIIYTRQFNFVLYWRRQSQFKPSPLLNPKDTEVTLLLNFWGRLSAFWVRTSMYIHSPAL